MAQGDSNLLRNISSGNEPWNAAALAASVLLAETNFAWLAPALDRLNPRLDINQHRELFIKEADLSNEDFKTLDEFIRLLKEKKEDSPGIDRLVKRFKDNPGHLERLVDGLVIARDLGFIDSQTDVRYGGDRMTNGTLRGVLRISYTGRINGSEGVYLTDD